MGTTENALARYEVDIRRYFESHMVDPDGIVYDGINCDTRRPFTKREAAAVTAEVWGVKTISAPPRFGPFLNYEDSDMATGDYLASQIYRFLLTGAGDARDAVGRSYHALRRIAEEGSKREGGFLPKPYGGLKGAAHSGETSADQYCKVVLALDLFRRSVASRPQREQARDLILAFADYWDRHYCTTIYFGELCHWNYSHPVAFLLYLMSLAHRLSRRKVFQRWHELLFERRGWLFRVPYCSGNMGNMIVRSMDRLHGLRPDASTLWRRAIRHNLRLAFESLHPCGYCLPNPTGSPPPPYLYGVSTQLASAAVCAADRMGGKQPLRRGAEILEKTGAEGLVYHMRFLGRSDRRPAHQVQAKKVSGYYMAGWQLAYWHRRWLLAGRPGNPRS